MVAEVKIESFHGTTPGTTTDITGAEIRFKRADNDTLDASDPMLITPGITTYSLRKHTKLSIKTAPDNIIENLRWFADETTGSSPPDFDPGFFHYAGADATYTEAPTTDVDALVAGLVNSTTLPSTSPLVTNPGTVATSGDSFPTYGGQDFVVQQMSVAGFADPGSSGAKSFVYRFDES